MKSLIVIPAKAKSNRLPNKNLLKIGEYTLVELAVERSLQSNLGDIIVSTDSTRIINIIKGEYDYTNNLNNVFAYKRDKSYFWEVVFLKFCNGYTLFERYINNDTLCSLWFDFYAGFDKGDVSFREVLSGPSREIETGFRNIVECGGGVCMVCSLRIELATIFAFASPAAMMSAIQDVLYVMVESPMVMTSLFRAISMPPRSWAAAAWVS